MSMRAIMGIEIPPLAWWLAGAGLVMFLATPLVVGLLVVQMPDDYLVRRRRPVREAGLGRLLLRVARNLAGAVLVLAGVVMLVTPGQGLLSVLAGLCLVDLPGKRRLILRIARQPHVYRAAGALRARFGKPPYLLPD